MSDASIEQPEWLKGFKPETGNPAWQPGMPSPNPTGRPKGSSKQQKLIKRLLEDADEVVEALLNNAKAGDPTSIGLVLSKILPSLRNQSQTVKFTFNPELPIARQVEQILAAIAEGLVPPDVGQSLINSIGTLSDIRATEELATRITQLEAKQI